jgi:hypothetical protein
MRAAEFVGWSQPFFQPVIHTDTELSWVVIDGSLSAPLLHFPARERLASW